MIRPTLSEVTKKIEDSYTEIMRSQSSSETILGITKKNLQKE